MKQFFCGLLALALVAGHPRPANADYLFTTLNGNLATGINDFGQIVGASDTGGFLYSGGDYTPISVPNPVRGSATIPYGINNLGEIIGEFNVSRDIFHGFLLSGGDYTTIDVPGSFRTFAHGINNAGQITGTYQVGSDTGPPARLLA